VCEVFGATGYIRTAYTYSPYGSVTATGNVTRPIQWSSEFYDEELGLVYWGPLKTRQMAICRGYPADECPPKSEPRRGAIYGSPAVEPRQRRNPGETDKQTGTPVEG